MGPHPSHVRKMLLSESSTAAKLGPVIVHFYLTGSQRGQFRPPQERANYSDKNIFRLQYVLAMRIITDDLALLHGNHSAL